MADSILRLKVESQEYDNKLKQATNGLTRYVDECRKVGGTLEVVEKETLDYVRALGQMDTTSRTATGKLAEMKKTFTELSAQYKQMTDAEKQSPFGKALAASLDQLKGRIGESKEQLDDINKSINGGGGLTGALDAVAGKFGLSIDQVTKFGGVVGVATTAIQVAKDAFFQSESGIDEWGRTVEGAKGAYSVFLDTLNNGNWSNFFQNLSAAIQGGRDLYDVFDRLGSIKSNNAAAIAITQKEIAELRLAKQQGENVDAKLKSATERLAALQKQSVSAGMAAGSQSAFQTIRNGVNSIGGAGVNDATIKYVVDKIIKGGQSEFDKYKRNYETLQQRGMVTRTQTINDSQGGTYERQYRVFDINALTKEQQKQYAIAKAITEGETRIQKGIAAYAQAVSEGTSAAREEFKGNRYALQGASGSGGGRSGGGKTETVKTEEQLNNEEIQKLTQEYIKASDDRRKAIEGEIKTLQDRNAEIKRLMEAAQGKAAPDGSLKALSEELSKLQQERQLLSDPIDIEIQDQAIKDVQDEIDRLNGKKVEVELAVDNRTPFEQLKDSLKIEIAEENMQVDTTTLQTLMKTAIQNGIDGLDPNLSALQEKMREGMNIPDETWQALQDEINEKLKELGIEPIKIDFKTGNIAKDEKKTEASLTKEIGSMAGGISQMVGSMEALGIKLPEGMKDVVSGVTSLISIVSGIATIVTAIEALTAADTVIPFARGGVVHAANGFVQGNNYSGDMIPAALNAGELVLNKAQQGNLASQLQGAGMGGMQVIGEISGEKIVLVANRFFKRTGQGEIVTW